MSREQARTWAANSGELAAQSFTEGLILIADAIRDASAASSSATERLDGYVWCEYHGEPHRDTPNYYNDFSEAPRVECAEHNWRSLWMVPAD